MAVSTRLKADKTVGFARLKEEVVGTGLCVSCGTCIGVCPSKCLIYNSKTELPELIKGCPPHCNICYEVCPGGDIPMPELYQMVFGRQQDMNDKDEYLLGISQYSVLAWSTDPWIRGRAASGGFTTALMLYALENDVIDAALLTTTSKEEPWVPVARICTNKDEVTACQHTKNARSPVAAVWSEALERGYQRLAMVGMPSNTEAIRKMQLDGKLTKLNNSMVFSIGLMDGEMGGGSAERQKHEHLIAEVLGVPLDNVAEVILHSHTLPGLYSVRTKDGKIVSIRDRSGQRTNHWRGMGRDRVAYDWGAELSDISAGGYFGRDARRGVSGKNVVMVRTDIGAKVMKDAEAAGYIETEPVEKGAAHTVLNVGSHWRIQQQFRFNERKRFGHPVPDYHIDMEAPRSASLRA